MLVDKSSEPLAQSTRLIGNFVQLTRLCVRLQLIQCFRRHKLGLRHPSQEPITALEPALVYVTALAPDEGEKVADVFYRVEPHPQAPKLVPDGGGLIWLPEGAFATAFAQNASGDRQAVLAAVQRPISLNCITVPAGRPLWKDVPSWFLIAEHDRMIAPQTQRYMAQRMKSKTKAHAVDHTPSVTEPAVVVDIIRDAIRSVTGN